MSFVLRRVGKHDHPDGKSPTTTHTEVCVINQGKVTCAFLSGVEQAGKRAAARVVFHLDNGQRFEADEVRIGEDFKPLSPELVRAIVDGRDVGEEWREQKLRSELGEG